MHLSLSLCVCVCVCVPTYVHVYLDMLGGLFRPIIPKPIVEPLPNQLQRRLRAKGVFGRHVEVVHEGEELLPPNGVKHSLGGEEEGEGEGEGSVHHP